MTAMQAMAFARNAMQQNQQRVDAVLNPLNKSVEELTDEIETTAARVKKNVLAGKTKAEGNAIIQWNDAKVDAAAQDIAILI